MHFFGASKLDFEEWHWLPKAWEQCIVRWADFFFTYYSQQWLWEPRRFRNNTLHWYVLSFTGISFLSRTSGKPTQESCFAPEGVSEGHAEHEGAFGCGQSHLVRTPSRWDQPPLVQSFTFVLPQCSGGLKSPNERPEMLSQSMREAETWFLAPDSDCRTRAIEMGLNSDSSACFAGTAVSYLI